MALKFIICLALASGLVACGQTSDTGNLADALSDPAPRPSSADNLTVCASATTTAGIDVSDYDTGTMWPTVYSGGARFAFIKATEGTNISNTLFATDWPAAKQAGLTRGAYHYFHPGEDAATQARYFLASVGALGANDLPPVLDIETTDGVTTSAQIAGIQTWLQVVENSTGRIPIIYVDPSFWNGLGNPQGFQRYPLFIANYGVNCPAIPPPWSNWTFWQSAIGTVAGVQSAQADQDLFNGSFETLFENAGAL